MDYLKEEARNLEGKISEMVFNFCRENGKQPSVINISGDIFNVLYRGEQFLHENDFIAAFKQTPTIFGLYINIVHDKVSLIELE